MLGKKSMSLWKKYKWPISLFIIILIIGYILVYLIFKGSGFLPVGEGLQKSDWLSFCAEYLSFAGTVAVSALALLQGKHYAEISEAKEKRTRTQEIRPIFSITIGPLNKQLNGTAEAVNLYKPESWPKHKNVSISIENVGGFPISHVIVYDKYLLQLMKSGQTLNVQCAYEDSPDYGKKNATLIQLISSECECDNGIPKWLNISYEDVDGNEWCQSFELKTFGETKYYSLAELMEF